MTQTTLDKSGAASLQQLEREIDHYAGLGDLAPVRVAARDAFARLKRALNHGQVRAAEPAADGWQTNAWVKRGILLGFRLGDLVEMSEPGAHLRFFDKDTIPAHPWAMTDKVRIVPGGSSIRDGSYLAPGVICMPPMYVNIGAWVGEGTLIDSHALVGSCAQVGARVHLSAAAQIGGVLEPVNASPVIIEDEVMVGGNCGIYEGTQVGRGAVLASGTILTRSTPVYDLINETVHRGTAEQPLRIPAGAVVVPGSRAVTRGRGPEWGLSLYTPVIVKYRDEKTSRAVELEEWLR